MGSPEGSHRISVIHTRPSVICNPNMNESAWSGPANPVLCIGLVYSTVVVTRFEAHALSLEDPMFGLTVNGGLMNSG